MQHVARIEPKGPCRTGVSALRALLDERVCAGLAITHAIDLPLAFSLDNGSCPRGSDFGHRNSEIGTDLHRSAEHCAYARCHGHGKCPPKRDA